MTGPKSTGGCLDECGPEACIEGEPQQVWHYVGPGQGQYDKVERYTPVVGGSWKIEQVNTGGIKWGSCAGWFCSFAAIVGIIVAVVIYRGVLVSAVSHDIEVVSHGVGQSPLSLFNCSRGSWTTSLKAQLDQASQVYRTSLWKQSDTNFDGILAADELSSSSSKLPSCFAQQIYQWDQDGNGLTQEEIEAGLQVEDVMDAEAEKMFAYADLDCDGALSLSELDRLRSEAQLPKYTTDLLGSADVDADNKLSKLEFVAAMRKSGVATAQGALLGEVWNETKRQWCCNYQAIGCGTYVYDIEESADCSHGVFELWSATKRAKCCELEGRGCLKRPVGIYDCYAKRPEEWTFKQRDFCCSSTGRGCHRLSLFSASSVFSLVEFPHFIAGSGSAASHKVVLRLRMGASSCHSVPGSREHGDCRSDTVLACSQQCSKDSTRDVKGFHEVRGTSWQPSQSKKQLQQAQRVVDQTIQLLGLGLPVQLGQAEVPRKLIVSQDAKTLELSENGDGTGREQPRFRIPMSQVVDISFGAKSNFLVLRFSEALCREPLELGFIDEEQRLQVALTLKVLRARTQ